MTFLGSVTMVSPAFTFLQNGGQSAGERAACFQPCFWLPPPQVEVVFVSEKKGNRDEVTIDQVHITNVPQPHQT